MRLSEELLKHPEFFFWIVIAIMFFILWRVNKGINKKVIEIRNRKVGISVTETGEIVFQKEVGEAVEILQEAFLKTSRLSGLGFILSSLGAVFSAIFWIIKN